MEMVKKSIAYNRLNKYSLFVDLCGKYEVECLKCITDGKYSLGYILQTSASALGLKITSVYPSLNGLHDKYKAEFNRSFYLRQGKSLKGKFLMWHKHLHSQSVQCQRINTNFPLIETEPN